MSVVCACETVGHKMIAGLAEIGSIEGVLCVEALKTV